MDFFHTESMLNEHENIGIARVIRQAAGFAFKGGVTSIGMYRILVSSVPCRNITRELQKRIKDVVLLIQVLFAMQP